MVVTGASVDYSGMLSSDKEMTGLRCCWGDGEVTVKGPTWTWSVSFEPIPP